MNFDVHIKPGFMNFFSVKKFSRYKYEKQLILTLFAAALIVSVPAEGNTELPQNGNKNLKIIHENVTSNHPSFTTSPKNSLGIPKFVYRKCFCGLSELFKNGTCQAVESAYMAETLQNIRAEFDHKILPSFQIIQNLTCSSSNFKIELKSASFYILEDGSIYNEEMDLVVDESNYCFEIYELDDHIEFFSQLCVPKPEIPVCSDELNTPYTLPFFINLTIGAQIKEVSLIKKIPSAKPICSLPYQYKEIPISLETESIIFHYVNSKLHLMWNPPFPATNPQIYSSDNYCISLSSALLQLFTAKICYDDPKIRHEQVCQNSTCIRKCCPNLQVFDVLSRKCSLPREDNISFALKFFDFETLSRTSTPQNLITEHYFPWCEPQRLYIIDPQMNPTDKFYLLKNGSLFIESSDLAMPSTLYCVDYFKMENSLDLKAISCFLDPQEKESRCLKVHKILYPILIVISCGFLTITLIVYSVISELRNKLHGKSLLSHVFSLLIAFLCQVIVSWNSSSLSMTSCKIIALGNQVSFLWAFFWLNVMCFDIWWTLKSMRIVPETGESSRRRFLMYSIYAWGCPIFICFVTALMEFLPNSLNKTGLILPGFGVRGCWFQDVKSTWIYFHGFTLVLYVLNIFFFFHVASILINGQRSTEGILRTTKKQHKERVYLYLKLFIVMGITWICEVASWQEGTCEYWLFTDVVNSLQGLMIFFIFMCNKKVYQKMQTKGDPLLRRMKSLVRTSSKGSTEPSGASTSPRTSQTSEEPSRRLSTSVTHPVQQLALKK